MDVSYLYPDSTTVYAHSGVQTVTDGLTDTLPNVAAITFTGNTITVTDLLPVGQTHSPTAFNVALLSSIQISNVTIDPSTYAAFASGLNFSFTPSDLQIDLSGACPNGCPSGESVVFDVATTPEPSSLACSVQVWPAWPQSHAAACREVSPRQLRDRLSAVVVPTHRPGPDSNSCPGLRFTSAKGFRQPRYDRTMNAAPLPPHRFLPGQTLLFDADDTLWENNIYFERAIAGFVTLVDHPTLSPAEVRTHFNNLEHARVQVHGYGTKSFRNSMDACLQDLSGRTLHPDEHAHLDNFAGSIANAPIELLPGVEPTLRDLRTRHRLVLVTKGDTDEQLDKLHRSGLAPLFAAAEVVREKHREMYEDLRSRHRLDASTTWMLGNSPKSDINPALAAGLHTVFLPHRNTWVLEHEDLMEAPAGQHRLTLHNFADLSGLF